MATVTLFAAGTISDSFENYQRDSVVIAGPTTYIWTSPDGHRVTLIGSFTYPGGAGTDPDGTVDQISIDQDDNGSSDLTIAYGGTPLDVADLLGANFSSFINAAR